MNPKHHALSRRSVLAAAGAGIASAFSCATSAAAQEPLITVHRDPNCGCCLGWVRHLQQAGFLTKVIETRELDSVKSRLGFRMIWRLATRRSSAITSLKGMCRPLRFESCWLKSQPQEASPSQACRSGRLAWKAARPSLTMSCCLDPTDGAHTCGFLVIGSCSYSTGFPIRHRTPNRDD